MNETSSTDLMDLCKKFDIECHGCYTPDELSELKKGNYILNLNGTSHWCGLIVGEPSVYFDSFGFPPDQKIEDMMDKYIYNPYDIQALPSSRPILRGSIARSGQASIITPMPEATISDAPIYS